MGRAGDGCRSQGCLFVSTELMEKGRFRWRDAPLEECTGADMRMEWQAPTRRGECGSVAGNTLQFPLFFCSLLFFPSLIRLTALCLPLMKSKNPPSRSHQMSLVNKSSFTLAGSKPGLHLDLIIVSLLYSCQVANTFSLFFQKACLRRQISS